MKHETYQPKVLRTAAWSIWILFVVAYAAMKFNVYYTLPWFDTAVHFCGGMVTALVVYVLTVRLRFKHPHTVAGMIAMLVVLSFGIGFFWEICEYVVNIILPTYVFDPVDTLTDLVADTSGALLVAIITILRGKKYYGK